MNSLLAPLQNYAPEGETRTMIRKMIQEREARLDSNRSLLESTRIQKEMASNAVERLRNQLAEAERAELVATHSFEAARKVVSDIEDTITEHNALIHPIRYLPSELLRQIFGYCTVEDAHTENMKSAIRLSSVCRTWRLVAHSLRALWKHIDFSSWNPSVDDIFASFLERSPDHLNIRVTIDSDRERMSSAPFSFTDFRFARIQTLIIFISSDNPFPRGWGAKLYYLTRLGIYADLEDPPTLGGEFLLQYPRLEVLELDGIAISFTGDFILKSLIRPSWKEHHHDDLTPIFLGRLFEHAPHLKSFSFFSPCPMKLANHLYECNLQLLRELTSLELASLWDGCFFSSCAIDPSLERRALMPSLQHLTLVSTNINDLLDSVVHHAETAYFTEVTLKILATGTISIPGDLEKRLMVLRRFLNLETLEVVGGGPEESWVVHFYSKIFIECLCEVLSECTVHPNFPSLRIIRFLRLAGLQVDHIIGMVKARTVAAKASPEKLVPLESVTFEDCEPLNVDEYRRLKAALEYSSS